MFFKLSRSLRPRNEANRVLASSISGIDRLDLPKFIDQDFKKNCRILTNNTVINMINKFSTFKKMGKGRNARQASNLLEFMPEGKINLSEYSSEKLINSQKNFYVRTEVPRKLDPKSHHSIIIKGLDQTEALFEIGKFKELAQAIGATMMECAGNDLTSDFGLMSAAHWHGILFKDFLNVLKKNNESTHVIISGHDEKEQFFKRTGGILGNLLGLGVKSTKGASWIFKIEELIDYNAFLAVKMNDEELTYDHGYPIRLVVPGWYGCASIKWLNQITFINADNQELEATAQMKEFADRTNQIGVPALYKDYLPATIDLAATPIKVEIWQRKGEEKWYRIIGLVWGGKNLSELDLRITIKKRFSLTKKIEIQSQRVELANEMNHLSWQLWSYWWQPSEEGQFIIDLLPFDQTISSRRLKKHHYRRVVDV